MWKGPSYESTAPRWTCESVSRVNKTQRGVQIKNEEGSWPHSSLWMCREC